MAKRIDLAGQRFHRWVALTRRYDPTKKRTHWLCRCDCGKEKWVDIANLTGGSNRSCGCLSRENTVRRNRKHGHAKRALMSKEYVAWCDMISRCYRKNLRAYRYYGARGITVCARWLMSFEAFLDDVGLAPTEDLSLDRIDNNGNYEPATPPEVD